MENAQKDELILRNLIAMFQTAALQHMGKLKRSPSDKIEKDLPNAKISIDILDMLYRKMKPNLSSDEERMFTTVLKDLKLNYVDEVNKSQQNTDKQTTTSNQKTS